MLIALGIMFVASGRELAPRDREEAQAFRTDPSCTASLSATVVPPGQCDVSDVAVLATEMRTAGGFSRTRSRTPYVFVRLADGRSYDEELDGFAGRDFVASVPSGSRARAQRFRGRLVRVASGKSSAETISAPDVNAASDAEMPWVGAGLIVIAVLIVLARARAVRRAGSAASAYGARDSASPPIRPVGGAPPLQRTEEVPMPHYCAVAFTDTLMAWSNDLESHVESGDRHSTFYFRISDRWAALPDDELQKMIFTVAQQMYADLNAGFRAAEPNDISYMLVKATHAQLLDAATVQAKPWLNAPNPAVWEPTPCVTVEDGGAYEKVTRDRF
jgi:hypothetical protein